MAQIKVIIQDHTGAKRTPVELPADVPMRRLIPALVTRMGLPTTQGGQPLSYALDHKRTGKRLGADETMESAGVQAEDMLLLLPTITAGGIPGLDMKSVMDFTLGDLLKSGEAALVMLVRRFEELEGDNKKLRLELGIEKQKSADRLVSTLLLLVSQIVLSIGTNLLTSDQIVPGTVVIAAGSAQALLAVYFAFRKRRQ